MRCGGEPITIPSNSRTMPPWHRRSRSVIESAPRQHPGDDGEDLRRGVRAALCGDLDVLGQQRG
jgi:hypothetical protein